MPGKKYETCHGIDLAAEVHDWTICHKGLSAEQTATGILLCPEHLAKLPIWP